MQAGTVLFNSVDLSGLGNPRLRIRREPDPAPPAPATRQLISLTVLVGLEAREPATIQARLRALQANMQVAEGILCSRADAGHSVEWLARPAGDNLSEALAGTVNEVELLFRAVELHSAGMVESLPAATLTPTGGSPISLHAVRDVTQQVATERVSPLSPVRRATTTTITFTARVAQADMSLAESARLSYLAAAAATYQALDCRTAQLTLPQLSTSRLVQVQALSPSIDPATSALDLTVQCFHVDLPGGSAAIATFTRDESQSEDGGETIVVLTGTIEAAAEATAVAKLDALRARHTTGGARLREIRATPARADGQDTKSGGAAAEEWTGTLAFTLSWATPRETVSAWQLRVSDREDAGRRRITYSGEVRGTDPAAVLAKARATVAGVTGATKVASEETLEYLVPAGATTLAVVALSFSYEFDSGAAEGVVAGEWSWEWQEPIYGEQRRTFSGYITATDESAARTQLAALISGEPEPIESSLRATETYRAEGEPYGSLTISGATPAGMNGVLQYVGTYAGKPAWNIAGEPIETSVLLGCYWNANMFGGSWIFGTAADGIFYGNEAVDTPDLVVAWHPLGGAGGTPSLVVAPGSGTSESRTFTRLEFTLSWRITHPRAAIQYKDETAVDYSTMLQTRTVSGTVRTNTAANAQTVLASLMTAIFGAAGPHKLSTGSSLEACGALGTYTSTGVAAWVQLDFSAEKVSKVEGTPAHDIVEATMSMQRVGSIDKPILHQIPFARPIAQVQTGNTIGTISISASCKARVMASARTWVQAKRALVNGIGTAGTTRHESAPPQETIGVEYAPFGGSDVLLHVFEGRYEWSFTNVAAMDSIWPGTLNPSF